MHARRLYTLQSPTCVQAWSRKMQQSVSGDQSMHVAVTRLPCSSRKRSSYLCNWTSEALFNIRRECTTSTSDVKPSHVQLFPAIVRRIAARNLELDLRCLCTTWASQVPHGSTREQHHTGAEERTTCNILAPSHVLHLSTIGPGLPRLDAQRLC